MTAPAHGVEPAVDDTRHVRTRKTPWRSGPHPALVLGSISVVAVAVALAFHRGRKAPRVRALAGRNGSTAAERFAVAMAVRRLLTFVVTTFEQRIGDLDRLEAHVSGQALHCLWVAFDSPGHQQGPLHVHEILVGRRAHRQAPVVGALQRPAQGVSAGEPVVG